MHLKMNTDTHLHDIKSVHGQNCDGIYLFIGTRELGEFAL